MNFPGIVSLTILVVLGYMAGQSESQAGDYVINTLMVMDAEAFVSWVKREPASMTSNERQVEATRKVKEYMSLVIRETNLRLASLKDASINWTIQLSVAGFSIGTDPLSPISNALTKTVSAESSVDALKQWVTSQGWNTQYDYVILLTGYDLRGDVSSPITFVRGIAPIGGLCQTEGSSVAIVEDKGAFQSVYFVAHEMGHSLGAIHDGEPPSSACPNEERYIMSINSPEVTSSNRLHPWKFSSCSQKDIDTFMEKTERDHPSCLTDSMTPAPEYVATQNQQPGQVFPAVKQCQHLHGTDSKLCLGKPFGTLDEICTRMFCLDPSSDTDGYECVQYQAAEGTCCGNGKMCQSGECLPSPLAPSSCPDTCSDSLVRIVDGGFTGTCQEYVSLRPQACYLPRVLTACCQSCAAIERDSEVCPYGDKKTGCASDLCDFIDVNGTRLEEICCGTCRYDVIKTCSDEASVDGMTCELRVRQNDMQGCYDPGLAYKCCKTCQDLRTSNTGCEYGDRTVGMTCQNMNLDNATCVTQPSVQSQCCYTCDNLQLNSARLAKEPVLFLHKVLMCCLLSILHVMT